MLQCHLHSVCKVQQALVFQCASKTQRLVYLTKSLNPLIAIRQINLCTFNKMLIYIFCIWQTLLFKPSAFEVCISSACVSHGNQTHDLGSLCGAYSFGPAPMQMDAEDFNQRFQATFS